MSTRGEVLSESRHHARLVRVGWSLPGNFKISLQPGPPEHGGGVGGIRLEEGKVPIFKKGLFPFKKRPFSIIKKGTFQLRKNCTFQL